MILTFGDTRKLEGQKWHILEIRSEKTAENTIRRVGNAMPSILGVDGVGEVFVPVGERDLDVYSLRTASYIFIRSNKKKELLKFKTITGVIGILCEGEHQRVDRMIPVEDAYVQGLIKECEELFHSEAPNIRVGSFCRILDGVDRGFCGEVVEVGGGYALVSIEMKTRKILVETPLLNLKDLGGVPEDQRVFYYCDVIKTYVEEFKEEALLNLNEDLKYINQVTEGGKEIVEEKKVHFGRQKTLTAIAKRMLLQGERDPKAIISEILSEVEKGGIKRPKDTFILYFVLKQVIKNTLFSNDPKVKAYRDIIANYGDVWRISPKTIRDLDTKNLIPSKE